MTHRIVRKAPSCVRVPRPSQRESGQLMLIAVLLMSLVVLCIPIVSWMNNQFGHFTVRSQKSQEARQAAEQAIAYATRVFSDTTTWNAALVGNFPPAVCGQTYKTSKGMQFLIQCS